jgi:hypothetical protein
VNIVKGLFMKNNEKQNDLNITLTGKQLISHLKSCLFEYGGQFVAMTQRQRSQELNTKRDSKYW